MPPDDIKGDGHDYMKNPLWWTAMVMLVVGEFFQLRSICLCASCLSHTSGRAERAYGDGAVRVFSEGEVGTIGEVGLHLMLGGLCVDRCQCAGG